MINNMTVSELIREVQNNANATLMERVLASALDNLGDEMDEKEKDIQKLEEALSKISRTVVGAFEE